MGFWSTKSKKYEAGACSKKWNTFKDDGGLTIATLYKWAQEDSAGLTINNASKNPLPSEYMEAVHTLGYHFTMNDMNSRIYVNGELLSDGLQAYLWCILLEHHFPHNENIFVSAFKHEAYSNLFHPIRDYLNSLRWDGKDYIAELCSHFKDKDGVFELYLRKWLVGSVNKILKHNPTVLENPMLVLDGWQGEGKSFFVRWLCSPLPQFFKSSPINPDDKDMVIDSVSYWIWEADELGSTFRRADREALKALFLDHKQILEHHMGTIQLRRMLLQTI